MNDLSPSFSEKRACQICDLVARLKKEIALNEVIARADPLGSDAVFHQLLQFNTVGDIEGIAQALAEAVAGIPQMTGSDFIRCSAAIRDLSILGGSLIRFGVEPTLCVPGFDEALQFLAAQIRTPIPRDSFIDYTLRNPPGERERTFTSLPEETLFIDSLRRGMAAVDACLIHVLNAYTFPFAHQHYADSLHAAALSFQDMIDGIVRVKRKITPEAFTHSIRPFFEPFCVAKQALSAPSGAETPILNIDQILWGADRTDEIYTVYFQANIIRLPAIYQEISQVFAREQSLITQIKARLAYGQAFNQEELRSLQALHQLLTKIYMFRMPHYKVAEENVILRQREQGEGQKIAGSSGFGLSETRYVLDQTISCRRVTAMALAR
jgi:monodechloroaminopyrrolnitrin synthase